jgi:PRTRC genetic system protein C
MALQWSALPREFSYNGSRIPDPDPKMEIEQVRELLTPFGSALLLSPISRKKAKAPIGFLRAGRLPTAAGTRQILDCWAVCQRAADVRIAGV